MIIEASSIVTGVAALIAVLALVWLVGRVARLGGMARRPASGGLLAVQDVLALDARRRLHLIKCDGQRVLLLTGGAQDVVVGWVERPGAPPLDPAKGVALGTPYLADVGGGADDDLARSQSAPPPTSANQVDCKGSAFAGGPGGKAPWSCLLAIIACLLPVLAQAQSLNIDLGTAGEAGATGRLVQITALVTVLSLAPSLLVMVTAFTRIVIVLSLLRSALSAQGTPPNMVLVGLALFLTFFVMQPVLNDAWTTGLLPMTEGRVGEIEGLRLAIEPFRRFMVANLRPADLQLFLDIAHLPPPAAGDDTPWRALVPAFLVGELRRAFEMGFLLFLPFMVIDMVVASVLMSLGMMMLPPSVVSLPFKLIFFVLVDGWRLVSGSLVQSFSSQ